jgi:succinate dehydrogenase/fumarate reductase-like Fe-S protein
MTVNGKARWTCRTHVKAVERDGGLEIGPLAQLPVIRDLVTDMSTFFDKWAKAKGEFVPTATRNDRSPGRTVITGAAGRGHRDRVHRLRHLLRQLRCRQLEPRLPRSCRSQSCVDARQRPT